MMFKAFIVTLLGFGILGVFLIVGTIAYISFSGNNIFNNIFGETPPSQALDQLYENEDRQKTYKLINEYRRENNLSPLVVDSRLEKSALDKARDMAENDYWSHRDILGKESWHFLKKNGYFYTHAGENLAYGQYDPEVVVEDWKDSPEHNKQLLDQRYVDMGIGFICVDRYQGSSSCIIVFHAGI